VTTDDPTGPGVDVETDSVHERDARALHQLLDADGPPPSDGQPLPPLWHWLAFLPSSSQRDLQVDGHVPLPVVPGDGTWRRMFAGGRVELLGPCEIGGRLTRTRTFSEPVQKEGRSGPLVFTTVRHEITETGQVVIVEEQDLVYRPTSDPGTAPPPVAPVEGDQDPPTADWTRSLIPDTRLLFRFSALTYNAHRIHYDLPYAQQVEGYPELVVHGPLQAILLVELLRSVPEIVVERFSFRGRQPAFAGQPMHCTANDLGASISLTASSGGRTTVEAVAEVASR
jgi:3-methylfumaryl-CoA hydratase